MPEIVIPDIPGQKQRQSTATAPGNPAAMSKSRGNVINPDELVEKYGADVVRCYLMFNFDWQKGGPWNEHNIKGPQGWLHDVWAIRYGGRAAC